MKIKQDPITKLWCREDGAILMPPAGIKFPRFRWTFGYKRPNGYCYIGFHNKYYEVHRIICRAFNGLPPADKPFCDHKNRVRHCNRYDNLRWASRSENAANADRVDRALEKYNVRQCEDLQAYRKAYGKTWYEAHREDKKAYDAAKRAEMKAQGLTFRKGPTGKWGWYPRIHT